MPTDRPIVFAARLPGLKFSQLYRINPDGSRRTPLTRDARDATFARCSPDGKWLTFRVGYDSEKDKTRWIVDIDGKRKPRKVTDSAEFDWVRDLSESYSPDLKWQLVGDALIDTRTEKETKLDGVTDKDVVEWLDSKWLVAVGEDAKKPETTMIRVYGTNGKLRHQHALELPKSERDRFDEEAGYSDVWQLHRVPIEDKFVLSRLGGGNREGKWPVGLLVDAGTGKATFWGEFGYSGMFFSPDGKWFVTALNRKNPETTKQENTLYLAPTSAPLKRKPLVKAADIVVGDWLGGLASG